jgi:Ser/Thr protein kinase RdoA (MazF antagonist)
MAHDTVAGIHWLLKRVLSMLREDVHPYERLTPDSVMAAVESVGWLPDGRLLALNSYENRVYQVGIEGALPLVVKFYRPERWSEAAILEEHEFALELAAAEVPIVAPLTSQNAGGQKHGASGDGATLFEHDQFRFAVFERRGGRWPDLGTRDEREWMGRFIARIHVTGRRRRFTERPTLSVERLGHASREWLLDQAFIPDHMLDAYESVSADVLDAVERQFEVAGQVTTLRIHGDCHPGNVLWTDAGPHFVDLDDCMNGPAIQDLWMLLSGNRREMGEQLDQFLSGYAQFAEFDFAELHLLEALRSLRIIHYAAWLARRWQDPAFPRAFPWFAEPRYWERHVLDLREQLSALDEGPLVLG